MRKILSIICFLAVTMSICASRTGKMKILGEECSYDTVCYRTIAPGAKLLQLQFNEMNTGDYVYHMFAHIIEIDMTNPYNLFTPKLASKGYYSFTNVLSELTKEQQKGRKAVASMSGFAFTETGNTSPTRKVAEVSGSMISKGVIHHQDRGTAVHYYSGKDRKAYVGSTHISGSVKVNGESWVIGQVNRFRDLADSHGEISLFCNGIEESQVSRDKRNLGIDVKVKLLNNTQVISGEEIECEVVSVLTGGNHEFDSGEAILSAYGTAEAKLKTLTPGQKVTIAINTLDDNNNKVDVENYAKIFAGYAVKDGVLVNGTNLVNVATVILGVSEDNTKTYIAALDGYRSISTYRHFADMMRNLGAYNAMFMDGGPSVDFAVDDKVITMNDCSSDGGRLVGSCFMLYSTAPDDANISKIEVEDLNARTVSVGKQLEFQVYGYNKYDDMINLNALTSSQVTAYCTNNLGTFNKNIFTATAEGTGELVFRTSSGYEVRIPITTVGQNEIQIRPGELFTGEGRPVQARLLHIVNGKETELDPAMATWTSSYDNDIVSCENGLIVPRIIGGKRNAWVGAEYEGLTTSVRVTIDDLDDVVDKIDLTDKVKNGKKVDYQLRSVPTSFTAIVETTPNDHVFLTYKTSYFTKNESKRADENGKLVFNVNLDYDDALTYPVTINEITTANSAAKIVELYATYGGTTGIDNVETSVQHYDENMPAYTLSGQRISAHSRYNGIIIQKGKKVTVPNRK